MHRVEQKLILACLMALVFERFQEHWGEFGGMSALALCMCWAGFTYWVEQRDSTKRNLSK